MSTMEFSAHKREASPEGLFEQDYKGQKNYSTRKTFDGRNVEERLAGRPYIYDKHEEIPNLPYYDDERIKSIEEYVEIDASKLYNAILLEMPKQRDTQLHHLAEEIHRLLRIDYPVTAIALHGNASTGKSSTLNNVVSKAGLAAASDAGRSCTQVATEYVSRKEDYPPFSAHVHWMSEDRIEKIVGNAADVLIHYYTTRSNEPNANAVADGDAMADDDNYAQVHTAQQFLQSVLCDRPTFLCEVSTAAFFCNNGKEIVARSMLGWIRENLKTTYGTWTTNNVTVVEATNLRLLRRELVPFQERGDDFSKEPRYWPLVDKVRCYIDSPFLQRGIELVDYPGTSDRNMMRRDRYQDDNCSAVLVTHQVSRAQTSQDLFNSLQRAIRIYGAENVILVLTNCDTADTDPYNLTHIENMTFTNLSKNIDKATTAFEDALEQDDIEKEEQARNELDNLKQIQEKRRILIRNEKLEKILQAEYKVLSPSSLIKVYPVANKAYEKHLSGSDRFSSHLLDVEETGIPDLRHAICTIHSERRMLRISEHYRRLRLATARILLFAEYDRLTRKADVDAIVWQQKKECSTFLDGCGEGMSAAIKTMFGREFQDQIKRVLSPMVKGLITTWGSKFTASSFKAFVTRDGIHQPKNGAYLNMTEELLRLVEKDVEPMHVEIAQIIDEKIELIIKKTTAMFDTIERQFDTSEHLGGVDMQNFMECFHQERITALAEVGAQAMALKRTLRKMHNDALEARPVSRRYPSSNSAQQQPQPLRQPSPFVTRMSEIYVEVSRMAGGKGSHNKRIQRFSSLVASSSTAWGPFPRLCDHLVQALSAPLGDFIGEKIVKGCIDATLDRVLQDLNIRFECGAGEAEGGGRRSEVNGELDEAARAELKIALADCVDRCKDVMESKLPALIYGDGHEFGGGTGSTSAIWSS